MSELLIRFVVGGLVVSTFALLGDVLKPKSFAGLFGAAPSVALATIGLTVMKEGKPYAALEARSMIIGAIAFLVYACFVSRVMMRGTSPALPVATLSLLLWIAGAFGLWYAALG
jgi:hypothetical protein